jgi:FkbM family methyltransferase
MLDPMVLGALVSWPLFSVTSYKMVSSLVRQQIMPKTVIDVGANVGQFAVAAAKLFAGARVYSFEPLPESFRSLVKNVGQLPQVTPVQAALGEAAGTVQLRVNSHSHSSSLLPLADAHLAAFPAAVELERIPVRQRTLDEVFGPVELESPVLLKLDVQGYETQTLRGGAKLLKRVQWVVAEGSLKPMYEGEALLMDLVELMRMYGFSFLRPVGFLPDPRTGEILQVDALFGHN